MLEQIKAIIIVLWLEAKNLQGDACAFVQLVFCLAIIIVTLSCTSLFLSRHKRISSLLMFAAFLLCSFAFAVLVTIPLPPLLAFEYTIQSIGVFKGDIFHIGLLISICLTVQTAVDSTIGYQSKPLKEIKKKWLKLKGNK